LLVGLENECEILEELEANANAYMEKQAWPYELWQIGNGQFMPGDNEVQSIRSKWRNRSIGENMITSYPIDVKPGGTGGQPIQALHELLNFTKENIIDAVMVPPISKQWSSTMASAQEMMPWARANLIQPMQEIIGTILEEAVYKPFLELQGFSVRVCPSVKWEAPDAHKDEEAEYWSLLVQSGIVPPEFAAEQLGFDMDKIKQLRDEEAARQEEAVQLQKVTQPENESSTI